MFTAKKYRFDTFIDGMHKSKQFRTYFQVIPFQLIHDDGNDAERLAVDPTMRHMAGGRAVGRPPKKPIVRYHSFRYQAASWQIARRVVAKIEWHAGELFPRVNFVVTNLQWKSG